MKRENEIEVIERGSRTGHDMKVTKGDKTVEFSPELSQQLCNELISLGEQFIMTTGKVTVEYFNTQANMYYAKLNAFISNQTLKSDERRMIFQHIEKLTDKYVEWMKETDDPKKIELLKSQYTHVIDKHSEIYMNALDRDIGTKIPSKPDLFKGLKKIFQKN